MRRIQKAVIITRLARKLREQGSWWGDPFAKGSLFGSGTGGYPHGL